MNRVVAFALVTCATLAPLSASAIHPCESGGVAAKFKKEFPVHWSKLQGYAQCFGGDPAAPAADVGGCNFFAAKFLEDNGVKALRYGADDQNVSRRGKYLVANDLATELLRRSATTGDFRLIGFAKDQKALESAQKEANDRRLVIAIRKGDGGARGHVAIVLPGTLTPSDKWGMNVPVGASWFVDKPGDGFVGCPLSFAFGPPIDNIFLYQYSAFSW